MNETPISITVPAIRLAPGRRVQITFERLTKVPVSEIVELMNHPSLRRHMPLLGEGFSDADCARFISSKETLWAEHGYGPWAFLVDGVFAGWGGFQWENGDPDVALVLHPRYWGLGKTIYRKIIAEGFRRWRFASVTALLPPGRIRQRVLKRLGFLPDGEVELQGKTFLRFRLHAPTATLRRPAENSAGPKVRVPRANCVCPTLNSEPSNLTSHL